MRPLLRSEVGKNVSDRDTSLSRSLRSARSGQRNSQTQANKPLASGVHTITTNAIFVNAFLPPYGLIDAVCRAEVIPTVTLLSQYTVTALEARTVAEKLTIGAYRTRMS